MKANVISSFKKYKYKPGLLLASVSLVGFSLFYIFPTIISLYYVFTKDMFNKKFIWFDNFVILFKNPAFLRACSNTFVFTFISVLIIMVLSFWISVIIFYKARNSQLIKKIFVLPMFIPTAAGIIFWKILFQDNGLLNHWVNVLSGREINFLNSAYTVGVVILIYIWKNIGFNIILMICGLQAVPKAVVEAAKLDGASSWKIMTHIYVPMMLPILFFTLIMSITNSFKIFKEAFLLTGDYPNEHVYLLQHFMNNQFRNLNFQMLSAAAFVVIILLSVVVGIIFKLEKGISGSIY